MEIEPNVYLEWTLRNKTRFSASFSSLFNCKMLFITSDNLDQDIEVYNG